MALSLSVTKPGLTILTSKFSNPYKYFSAYFLVMMYLFKNGGEYFADKKINFLFLSVNELTQSAKFLAVSKFIYSYDPIEPGYYFLVNVVSINVPIECTTTSDSFILSLNESGFIESPYI